MAETECCSSAKVIGRGAAFLWLSEDLQHGQRIEGLRIENPFKA